MSFWKKEIRRLNREYSDNPKRLSRFLKQYKKQGWTDEDTWSLDHSLAKVILPRLRRFLEIGAPSGTPGSYLPGGIEKLNKEESKSASDEAHERWLADVKSMIEFFEFAGGDNYWDALSEEEDKKVRRGLYKFADMYRSLWW